MEMNIKFPNFPTYIASPFIETPLIEVPLYLFFNTLIGFEIPKEIGIIQPIIIVFLRSDRFTD